MDWSRLVGVEYQALAIALPPLTAAAVAALARALGSHWHNAAVQAYATRLVAWAQQAVPGKSARYAEVATLLAQRYPALTAADVEVLIESEVHALKVGLGTAVTPAVPAAPVTAAALTGWAGGPARQTGPGGATVSAAPGAAGASVGPTAVAGVSGVTPTALDRRFPQESGGQSAMGGQG